MTKLKNTDLIEEGIFDKFQKDAKLAESSLRLLESAILDTQKASAALAEATPLEGYKNIQLRVKAVEDYEDAEKSLAKVQAEREKLAKKKAEQEAKAEATRANDAAKETARQAKAEATRAKMAAKEADRQSKAKKAVKDMSDAEIKAETIQKKQDADRIKRLKAEAVLLDDQAGALEKLAAKNRLLAQERESMPDISTPEAKARITEINAEINTNNELIAENSDKLKQQKMNVGNYTDSILEALGASKDFVGGVAGVTSAFEGLNPILAGATKGYQWYTSWAEKARSKAEATRANDAAKETARQSKAEATRAKMAAKETARQSKAEATRAKMAAKETARQAKAKKAVKDMSDAEIKAETIQKKQDADRIKRLKAEAVLLDDQAGALEKLAAKNRLLAQERESMPDISTPEAKAEQKRANDAAKEADRQAKAEATRAKMAAKEASRQAKAEATRAKMAAKEASRQAKAKKAGERSVSRTRKAFVGLAVSAGALAGGALTLLATAFAKSRAGGEQLAVIQQKISTSAGILANEMLDATGQTANFGNEADKATYKLKELQAETEDLQKLVSNDPRVKQSKVVTKALEENKKAISDLKNELIELEKKGITPVRGSGQTLAEIWNDDSINKYIKLVSDLRVQTGAYSIELARLNGLAEANDAIEGNNTLSLNDRITAMKEAIKYTEQAAKKQEDLNRTALEIANLDLYFNDRVNLAGLFDKWGVTAENAGTKITELYETNQQFASDLDSSANPDKLNASQAAMANLITAEFQLRTKQTQNQAKLDMAVQDQAEMDLDMLQDTFGKKLTLIEAEIAKTRVATAEKIALQNHALSELERTSKRTREVLTQEGLAGSKNKDAILNLFEIEDLDTLNKAIRQLEKSEMIEKRVQQYIEDYKEYLVQVADLKKDIADEEERILKLNKDKDATNKITDEIRQAREAGGTVEEINAKIAEIEKQAASDALEAKRDEINQKILLIDNEEKQKREKIASEIQEIEDEIEKNGSNAILEEKKRFMQAKLDALNGESEDRATALKDLADVELEIERNKTQAYIDEQQKREDEANKALEADKEALKKRNEMAQAGASFMENLLKKQAQRRIDAVDKQISASDKQISALEETARAGVESSTENLAYETKKRAELEADREKEIKRMKRMELALALIKVYAAKVAAGDKNPLASTAVEMVGMQALVESLPAFFEGTNEKTVGEVLGKPDIAGRDGYIVRVDRDETILNADRTREYHASLKEPDVQPVENNAVLKKLDGIADAIASKPVYMGRDYNATERAVIDTVETRLRITRTHRKGGVFGN